MQFVLNNWYLFLGLVVVLVMLVLPTLIQQRYGIKSLTPAQTVQLVNRESAVVVDVREPGEYRAGHITNAINVPLSTLALAVTQLDKYKRRPVVVVCRTSQRALKAATRLRKLNFSTVHILGGGLTAWERATLPLEK
jgi:rhodanese-related sulfurtransferase